MGEAIRGPQKVASHSSPATCFPPAARRSINAQKANARRGGGSSSPSTQVQTPAKQLGANKGIWQKTRISNSSTSGKNVYPRDQSNWRVGRGPILGRGGRTWHVRHATACSCDTYYTRSRGGKKLKSTKLKRNL